MKFGQNLKKELKVIITDWLLIKGLLKPGRTRYIELCFRASAEALKPKPKKKPIRKKSKSL